MMPYLTFNFYPTVMVEKNDNAFCDHSAFAFNFGSIDQIAVGHGLKMTQTMLTVYSILLFSVNCEENPMFAGFKQGSRLGDVGLAGVCLGVLGKGCVGPEVDVVVGMEYPGAALAFEGHHHQLH